MFVIIVMIHVCMQEVYTFVQLLRICIHFVQIKVIIMHLGPKSRVTYDLCFYAQSVYICTIIAYLYTLCAHKSGQNFGLGAPKAKLIQILTMNVGEANF